jgi:hypothetical protein
MTCSPSLMHEFSLDVINILNTRNVLRMAYQPDQQKNDQPKFKEEYQLGLLPFFYYRWSF